MSKMSRQIVVDASIARSAGTTDNPVSVMCRDFLRAMLRICHKLTWTEEIEQEWRKHASGFTSSWLAAMQSRGKVVRVSVDPVRQIDLANLITEIEEWPPSWREAAIKDLLLVVAAWESDELVASGDDRVRKLFGKLTSSSPDLGRITWVNPSQPAENPLRWLEAGARRDHERQLGAEEEEG